MEQFILALIIALSVGYIFLKLRKLSTDGTCSGCLGCSCCSNAKNNK